MKKILIGFSFFICAIASHAQSLSLDSCYAIARRNFPLIRQLDLVEKSKEYSIENANKSYLPQIVIAGQATYQSDVTSLPVKLPFVSIPEVSQDQYKIFGEINQPITDLFNVKNQRAMEELNADIESQKAEAELYKLKERINNIYFGILLIDGQIRQTELLKKDLQAGINKTQAAIDNGTALKSNLNILKAENLKADQRLIELSANRKAFVEMLSLFLQQQLQENFSPTMPEEITLAETINRPELQLYQLQKSTGDIRKRLLNARYLPKASLFFQGGYGRPALNMLNNEFDTYYITGLKLNWNITGYYTLCKEKKIIDLNTESANVQEETFLFNTKLSMTQQKSESGKYRELMQSDNEIITLRQSVKETSAEQLKFGTITANDYIVNVNAEDQARQNLLLHQIQLLMSEYSYKTTSGN